MKYCSYCGRMLNDGETCNCRNLNTENTQTNINTAQPQTGAVQSEIGAYQPAPATPQSDFGAYQPGAEFNINNETVYGGTPAPKKSFPKKGIIIGAACGVATLAVIGLVIFLVLSNSTEARIYKAFKKTFSESGRLMEDIGKFSYNSSDMTVSLSGQYDDYSAEVYFTMDGKDKGAGAKLLEDNDTIIEAAVTLDDKNLKVNFPGLGYDKVLVYDYRSEDKGDISDFAHIRTKDLEQIDTMLDALYEISAGDADVGKEAVSIMKDWAKELTYEKCEPKSIKVDKEKRECDGYDITITGENIASLVKKIYEYAQKQYADKFEEVEWDDVEDYIDRISDEAEELDDIVISCYMYDGMLAAIVINVEDHKFTIEFNGGDYRMQNVVAYIDKKSDANTVFEIKGSRSDSKETVSIEIPNAGKFEYKYTFDSGKLEFTAYKDNYWSDGYEEVFSLKCNLETSGSSIAVTLSQITVDGTKVDLHDTKISFSSSSSMPKMKGSELDITKADEDDLEEEFEDLEYELKDALLSNSDLLRMFQNLMYYGF